MRDLTTFQCPRCGKEKHDSRGRMCDNCGYQGDWIQPGEIMTYADNKKFLGVDSITKLDWRSMTYAADKIKRLQQSQDFLDQAVNEVKRAQEILHKDYYGYTARCSSIRNKIIELIREMGSEVK